MISLENQPPCPLDFPPKFDGFIVAFGGGWEGAGDYSKKYFLKKSPLYPNKFQLT